LRFGACACSWERLGGVSSVGVWGRGGDGYIATGATVVRAKDGSLFIGLRVGGCLRYDSDVLEDSA
jgi:hypothetical protein